MIDEVVQEEFINYIKLNYRCPKGKFVADSFKCGKTPEKAKENYEKWQSERGKKTESKDKTIDNKKKLTVVKDSKETIKDASELINKIKSDKMNNNVDKESINKLKSVLKDMRPNNVSDIKKVLYSLPKDVYKHKDKDLVTKEMALKTAHSSDIYAKIDMDLGEISSKEPKMKSVKGVLDSGNIKNIKFNAESESKRYENYLAPDTMKLLNSYIGDIVSSISDDSFKNSNAEDIDSLVRDSIKKLVYQEVEASKKSFSDHGIRHIVGNINRQSKIMDALGDTNPKEKLMAKFIMINHDIGYTTPLIRNTDTNFSVSMTKYHPDMSAKILEEQRNIWNNGKIFTTKEYDKIINIVRTHDSVEIDNKDILATSARLSDNLALFAKDKLPSLFKYVDDSKKILIEMGKVAKEKDEQSFNDLKEILFDNIDNASNMHPILKRDLKSAVNTTDFFTPKFSLGTLSGEISDISKNGDKLSVTIDYNEFDKEMQKLFDMGQQQTKKFLDNYGIKSYNKNIYNIGDFLTIKINKYGNNSDNSIKMSESDKSIINKVIDKNIDSPYFKNGKNDIHDLSNGKVTSKLIVDSYWNKDEYEAVKRVALENAKTPVDKSRVESAIWTMEGMTNGNMEVVGNWSRHDGDIIDYQKGKPVDNTYKEMAEKLEKVLKSGPKYNGEVFRGIGNLDDNTYNNILNAKEFKWNTLSATSANKQVADMYATGTWGVSRGYNKNSIVFDIKKSKSGVYISDNASFAGLDEVLVPKDTSYKVLGVRDDTYVGPDKKKYNIKVMELEEI